MAAAWSYSIIEKYVVNKLTTSSIFLLIKSKVYKKCGCSIFNLQYARKICVGCELDVISHVRRDDAVSIDELRAYQPPDMVWQISTKPLGDRRIFACIASLFRHTPDLHSIDLAVLILHSVRVELYCPLDDSLMEILKTNFRWLRSVHAVLAGLSAD